jgi:hypothetical protein
MRLDCLVFNFSEDTKSAQCSTNPILGSILSSNDIYHNNFSRHHTQLKATDNDSPQLEPSLREQDPHWHSFTQVFSFCKFSEIFLHFFR